MRKLLIGCGIVVLVLFILTAAAGVFIFIKLRNWTNSMERSWTQLEETNKLYTGGAGFASTLDEDRLKQYFEIRTAVVTKAEENPVIAGFMGAENSQAPSFWQTVGLMTTFIPEMSDAIRAQLDAKRMSLNEYQHMTRTIYSTVLAGHREGDPEMSEIYRGLQEGIDRINLQLANTEHAAYQVDMEKAGDAVEAQTSTVPKANYDLVARNRDEILANTYVAFLELLWTMGDGTMVPTTTTPGATYGT